MSEATSMQADEAEREWLDRQMEAAIAALRALGDSERDLVSVRGAGVGAALHTVVTALRESWFGEPTLAAINEVLGAAGYHLARLN
jgi:hypothetical protein